jgi:rhodanese-related sulfurtransferase
MVHGCLNSELKYKKQNRIFVDNMRFITPADCKAKLDRNELQVIDIREKYEYIACNAGFTNIPMAEFKEKLNALNPRIEYVVMCRSGKRAEALVNFLETEFSYANLLVLEGGIQGWAAQIDQSLQLD